MEHEDRLAALEAKILAIDMAYLKPDNSDEITNRNLIPEIEEEKKDDLQTTQGH